MDLTGFKNDPDHYFINTRVGELDVRQSSTQTVDILQRTGIRRIRIKEWQQSNLDLLRPVCGQIEHIVVQAPIPDLSALIAFPSLRILSLRQGIATIDFAAIPSLEELVIGGDDPEFGNLTQSPSLRVLTVNDCGLRDLEPILGLRELRDLSIVEGPFRSLEGIESFEHLESLALDPTRMESLDELSHSKGLKTLVLGAARRLTSIAALTKLPRLETLILDGAKQVTDLELLGKIRSLEELQLEGIPVGDGSFLRELTNLRLLMLERAGTVTSLSVLTGLDALERVTFFEGTIIEDGDLSVLLSLPKLKQAAFRNRRNYSLRYEEVKEALDVRSQPDGG